MFNRFGGSLRSRALILACVVAASAAPAMAQTTPSMEAIEFPIDPASIGLAVAGAGATILLIVFGYKVGFGLVKRVLSRVHKAV
jgi:hypothetical protein